MGNLFSKDRIRKFLHFNLWIVLFDIAAFSMSYLMTLYIRLYVNGIFRVGKYYLFFYWNYIPYYTVAAVVVFALLRLYGGMWQYAGLHDLNRLFTANIITAVLNIVISILVISLIPGHEEYATRMPTSYYVLGSTIQFIITSSIRFINRIIQEEKRRISKRNALGVMLVGTGETARIVRRQLEDDPDSGVRVSCVFAYKDSEAGGLMDGAPVLAHIESFDNHLTRYQVQRVILADPFMPMSTREWIRTICQAKGIEIQDFSGFLRYDNNGLSFRRLMECVEGKVIILQDGVITRYDNGEQALMTVVDKHDVKSVTVRDNCIFVELISYKVNPLIVFIRENKNTSKGYKPEPIIA